MLTDNQWQLIRTHIEAVLNGTAFSQSETIPSTDVQPDLSFVLGHNAIRVGRGSVSGPFYKDGITVIIEPIGPFESIARGSRHETR